MRTIETRVRRGWRPVWLARGKLYLLSGGLVFCLAALTWASQKGDGHKSLKSSAGRTDAAIPASRFDATHPIIAFEGIKAEVHQDGVPLQALKARWGEMDEKENILDLRRMEVKFFDAGKETGQALAGYARTWLKDRPAEKIATHDMVLSDTVTYKMSDQATTGTMRGWVLQTPALRYTSSDATLRSNQGYLKQMPAASGYYIGRGNGFEIKLLLEKSSFETYKEYGDPAVIQKSEKPVIVP